MKKLLLLLLVVLLLPAGPVLADEPTPEPAQADADAAAFADAGPEAAPPQWQQVFPPTSP